MELRFTVWQFVRLMVRLEDSGKLSAEEQALFAAWQDDWTALDQDLTRLAEEDFDAYSEMMMDQDVVMANATPAQAQTAAGVLTAVMKELDAAIEQGGDEEQLQSLKFERRELRQLSRKLSRGV